jgi:hypothetical protein
MSFHKVHEESTNCISPAAADSMPLKTHLPLPVLAFVGGVRSYTVEIAPKLFGSIRNVLFCLNPFCECCE